jgi:protein TonB
MTKTPPCGTAADAFSIGEIARAARVPVAEVRAAIARAGVPCVDRFVQSPDAVRLVRQLRQTSAMSERPHAGAPPRRRRSVSLAFSGSLHALLLAVLIGANWMGLLQADQTTVAIKDAAPAHLVFFMSPGPGGGGGGGGLQTPVPAARARVHVAVKKKISDPVPPLVKKVVPPPPPPPRPTPAPPIQRPLPPPVVQPIVAPEEKKSPPAPAIQAPVVPVATDPIDRVGLPSAPATQRDSAGPGSGGGAGTGTGSGLGEGHGPGIGEGSGGGTGGGPYHPGTDIQPPILQREVKPDYTDDARRRAIEGDVGLEIVVRRDGTVGAVRVLQTLAGGLEQKAIDAVRQWRFAPATRRGSAVEVVVTVSVAFKLR